MGGDDRGGFALGKRKANDQHHDQHRKRPKREFKVRFAESVSSSTSHIQERPHVNDETGQRSFNGNSLLKGKPRSHLERSDSMERFSRSGSSARQLESFSSSRKPVAAFSGSFDERVPRKVAGEDLRSRPPSLSELRNYREKRDDTRSRQSSSRSIKGQDIHRSESRSNWSERRSRQGSREREYQGDRRRVHRSSSTEEVSSGSSHVPDTAEPVRCILYKGNGVYVGQVKLTAPKSATETLARREIWGELLHLPGLHLRHMLDLDHAKRAYASWDSAQDFLVAPIESEDFQDQARLSSLAKYLKEKEKVGLISHGSLLAIVAPSENSNEMFRQDINQVAHLQLSVVKVSCALKAFGSTYLNLPKLPYEHHSLLESYHRALYKKLHGVTKKFQSFLKGSRVWPFAPSGRYTSEFKCLLGYYGAHTVDHALDADIVFIHQSYISRIPTMSELTKLKRRPVHFLKWGSTLATMQESPEVSIVFPGESGALTLSPEALLERDALKWMLTIENFLLKRRKLPLQRWECVLHPLVWHRVVEECASPLRDNSVMFILRRMKANGTLRVPLTAFASDDASLYEQAHYMISALQISHASRYRHFVSIHTGVSPSRAKAGVEAMTPAEFLDTFVPKEYHVKDLAKYKLGL